MLKQRALLKSIISFNSDDKKELENLLENFRILSNSNIDFSVSPHVKIFSFIKEHAGKCLEVPSINRLQKRFEEDSEIQEELGKISKEVSLYGSNYRSLVHEVYEEQQKRYLMSLLKDVSKISESGLKVNKKEFLIGPKEAAKYFLFKSQELLKPDTKIRLESHLKGESKISLEEYFKRKNENIFKGLLCGLETIDLHCKGISPGDLWLIMAYSGELKTTLSMNFAYTQAIEQKKNVKFITLEMTEDVCRDIFICLHSANYNLWAGSEWDDVWPLEYNKVEQCMLTEREEEFFEFLCNDWDNNPDYGDVHIYEPDSMLTMSVLKSWAEVEYRKNPFDIIYVDYIELMRDDFPSGDYTEDLNRRIKDLKQFALHFNGGEGIRMVSAYQANRKGKEYADKNDGEYRLDALSYANEAERSADVVLSSYLNKELREHNEVKIGCLKNRKRGPFDNFIAKTQLSCRKVFQPAGMIKETSGKTINDHRRSGEDASSFT